MNIDYGDSTLSLLGILIFAILIFLVWGQQK